MPCVSPDTCDHGASIRATCHNVHVLPDSSALYGSGRSQFYVNTDDRYGIDAHIHCIFKWPSYKDFFNMPTNDQLKVRYSFILSILLTLEHMKHSDTWSRVSNQLLEHQTSLCTLQTALFIETLVQV